MDILNENLGFIILSPEHTLARLKLTNSSITHNYPGAEKVCVVPKSTHVDDVKEAKNWCPTHKSKESIISLINTGFKHSEREWMMLVVSGCWVQLNVNKKYSYFCKSENDIFFPVVCDYNFQGKPSKIYNNFWDCSLNGIMIHRSAYKKIGNFNEKHEMENSRLLWSAAAVHHGCTLRAVLGIKIC